MFPIRTPRKVVLIVEEMHNPKLAAIPECVNRLFDLGKSYFIVFTS